MSKFQYRGQKNNPPQNIQRTILGQVTVAQNVDLRIERRSSDELLHVVEVAHIDTYPPRQPVYRDVYAFSEQGLTDLSDCLTRVLDGMVGANGEQLPIGMSQYDERLRS